MLLSSNVVRSALLLGSLVPVVRSAVFDVIVGGPGGLRYEPEFVTAAPGDQVRFIFRQKNHTATQSTFDNPCALAPGGFDSGFIPVAETVTEGFPVAQLDITSTDPIWVYCKQGNHCQQGMVFAINPADRFAAFKAAATGGAAPPEASASDPATASPPVATASSTVIGAPSPSASSPTGTNHRVLVGANGLVFEPSSITAQPGDKITFEFRAKNHTVTASNFEQPCVPLSQSTGQLGFDSGYQPVAEGSLNFPTYEITVNDTRPIWAYCAQGNHCAQGMVFAVNAVEDGPRNFTAFQDLAKKGATDGDGGYGSPVDPGSAMSTRSSLAGAAVVALLTSVFLF